MEMLLEKSSSLQNNSIDFTHYKLEGKRGGSNETVANIHEEYEIAVILGGNGQSVIGDTTECFSEGKLFIIGPMLYHKIWLDEGQKGDFYSINFSATSFGDKFFYLPENKAIRKLLLDSKLGISFSATTAKTFESIFKSYDAQKGFEKMISLFTLLNDLAHIANRKVFVDNLSTSLDNTNKSKDIIKIYHYVNCKFREGDLSQGDIADHVNMSTSAFCRFFKKHFNKHYSKFLNEVRINHACEALMSSDMNIAQVAFASGYNNVTNFNRQFKKITGLNPSDYAKRYHL